MDETHENNVDATVRTPSLLARVLEQTEQDERLDAAAAPLARVAELVESGTIGAVLRGEWLGHALHPLLTDFPLGCWLSAGLLDLVGGRAARPAAQQLVGLGLVFVTPTALSGLADWGTVTDPRTRRVGVVHAVGNTAVALSYLSSWRARRRGHHSRGVLWGLLGGTLAWGTGYLGGHLSLARGAGQGLRGLDLESPAEEPAAAERVT
jgi:uncharacterized membrane protein